MQQSYEQMATIFCKKHGAKVTISFICRGRHFVDDKDTRNIYRIKVCRNGKTFTYRFGDSIFNTQRNDRPTKYSVLACLTKYEPESDIWDFAREYGYEISSRDSFQKVQRIHAAVKREYAGVMNVFGDIIDQFREIS